MLRPDLWGGLGDVSGDAAFEYCYLEDFPRAWATLREHDSIEAFWEQMLADPKPSEAMFAAVNAIAMAACYSPGPDGEPVLPFALDDCSLREDVWERWLEWDPVRMLPSHLDDLRSMRAISLECGLQDEYNLYAGTAILHSQLEDAGIEHRFELFEGTHGARSPLATRRWSPGLPSGSPEPEPVPALRRATVEDAGEVARLLHDFNTEFDEYTPGVAVLAENAAKLIGADEAVFLLGGDGPDGIAELRFRTSVWTDAPDAYLEELYVAPKRRGEGIGRALLEAAIETATEAGAKLIDLGTSADDVAAIALYESAGFTNREGRPDGPRMLVYEREL